MIRGKEVLGLIYSNSYEENVRELTALRTMGSIPFGARYRMIDFTLSAMVNAGINKVGVVTKNNYQSLMDHVGNGKPWDLARKRDGLFILPPFMMGENGSYTNRIEALKGNMRFITLSQQEYVLCCDCNLVMNFPYDELFAFHEAAGADITVLSRKGKVPDLKSTLLIEKNADGRITSAKFAENGEEGEYAHKIYFMKKSLLEMLINEAAALKKSDFDQSIIMDKLDSLKIFAMENKTFTRTIDSLNSYYLANMALIDSGNMLELFDRSRPVYTKERDDMPARYGIGSKAEASLVSGGCVINGTVEHSLLGRGVMIDKNAVVKNSVIMQDCSIGAGCVIENIILDKNVVVRPGKKLCGADNYPIYVGKGILI